MCCSIIRSFSWFVEGAEEGTWSRFYLQKSTMDCDKASVVIMSQHIHVFVHLFDCVGLLLACRR